MYKCMTQWVNKITEPTSESVPCSQVILRLLTRQWSSWFFVRLTACLKCSCQEHTVKENPVPSITDIQAPSSQQDSGIRFQKECDRMWTSIIHRELRIKVLLFYSNMSQLMESGYLVTVDVASCVKDPGHTAETTPPSILGENCCELLISGLSCSPSYINHH